MYMRCAATSTGLVRRISNLRQITRYVLATSKMQPIFVRHMYRYYMDSRLEYSFSDSNQRPIHREKVQIQARNPTVGFVLHVARNPPIAGYNQVH
jgi:hypothetical protein